MKKNLALACVSLAVTIFIASVSSQSYTSKKEVGSAKKKCVKNYKASMKQSKENFCNQLIQSSVFLNNPTVTCKTKIRDKTLRKAFKASKKEGYKELQKAAKILRLECKSWAKIAMIELKLNKIPDDPIRAIPETAASAQSVLWVKFKNDSQGVASILDPVSSTNPPAPPPTQLPQPPLSIQTPPPQNPFPLPEYTQSPPSITFPENAQSSPSIPENAQSSPSIPENAQSSPSIPENAQSSPSITDESHSSPMSAAPNESPPSSPPLQQTTVLSNATEFMTNNSMTWLTLNESISKSSMNWTTGWMINDTDELWALNDTTAWIVDNVTHWGTMANMTEQWWIMNETTQSQTTKDTYLTADILDYTVSPTNATDSPLL